MAAPLPDKPAAELAHLKDEDLQSIKLDLEQRLARFQKAFHDQHNRNPTEEERKPARPAIKKYRQVCTELAVRRKARAAEDAEHVSPAVRAAIVKESTRKAREADVPTTLSEKSSPIRPAKLSADVKPVKEQRSEERRPEERRPDEEKKDKPSTVKIREVTESDGATGPAKGEKVELAVRAKTREEKREEMKELKQEDLFMSFTSFMGGSVMITLIFDWGQLIAIWGEVSLSTQMRLEGEGYDVLALGSWIVDLELNLWRWTHIFNLDIDSLRANFNFSFLDMIGWREQHLGFTVLIPLFISAVTVCLLRSVGDMARLALLTVSVLILVFGFAANIILSEGKKIRAYSEEEEAILGISEESLFNTLVVGAGVLLLALFLMIIDRIQTYRKVRTFLEKEVETLSHKLAQMKNNLSRELLSDKRGMQEDLPNAAELKQMLDDDAHTTHIIGGRHQDADEFLRQMVAIEKAKKSEEQGMYVPNLMDFTRTLVIWVVVSMVALILWLRVLDALPREMLEAIPDAYSNNYFFGAIVMTVVSLVILLQQFLTLSAAGQRIVNWTTDLCKAGYVGFLCLILLILYIPVTKQALSVFICDQFACERGTWFPVQSPGTDATLSEYIREFAHDYENVITSFSTDHNNQTVESTIASLGPASTCQACQWLGGPAGGQCPAVLANELCAPSTSSRFTKSPSINCEQQWPFYLPGCFLILLMFTIGVPYVFYQLTWRHNTMYESLAIYETKRKNQPPIRRKGWLSSRTISANSRQTRANPDGYTQWEIDDLWLRRVRRSVRNRARKLYADFEYNWRYWKLLVLLVKFLVIMVDCFKTKLGDVLVAPVLMLFIHSTMLCLSAYARPYSDRRPDLFSMAISLANVFNWTLLMIFAAKVQAPQWIVTPLVFINVGMPVLAYLTGFLLNRQRLEYLKKEYKHKSKTSSRKYLPWAEVQKKRRHIERHINEFTLRMISRWTWAVLFCTVIGGELIFIGTFAEAALAPITGHTAHKGPIADVKDCYKEEYARAQEFIGFGSWRNFTDNCCCMSRANVTDTSPAALQGHIYELWACVNAGTSTTTPVVYKERMRRDRDELGSSVAPVRGFCEVYFRPDGENIDEDYEPEWNEELQKFGVWYGGPNGTFYDDFW